MNLRNAILVVLLLAAPLRLAAQNLIANGSFDLNADGWQNQAADLGDAAASWSADGGRDGSACIRAACAKGDATAMRIWRAVLAEPPYGKRLRFAGLVRGRSVGFAGICTQVWDRDHKALVQFGTTQSAHALSGDFDWTRIDATVAVPLDAGEVHLLTMVSGGGEAWFDDVEVTVDGDATQDDLTALGAVTARPGTFRLRGEYRVSRRSGWFGAKRTDAQPTLLFPMPLAYGAQVPLSYEVTVEPADQLVSACVFQDAPGNFVAEIVLKTPADDAVTELRWNSVVLCGPSGFATVPESAPLPEEWPEDVLPWLESTRICQADHDEIQTVAKTIRGDRNDVLAIVAATLERAAEIQQQQDGACKELDALEALHRTGSCTSNANLLAALLRAQGVPARVLAGYPTWSGPLQTHYTVEAFVPGHGWYPIESTLQKAPWPAHGQIQVAIVPIDNEGESSRPRESAAGGVPYLSLTEVRHPRGLFLLASEIDGKQYCDHVARQLQIVNDLDAAGWTEVLTAARARWDAWVHAKSEAGTELATALRSEDFATVTSAADLRARLAPR
ncbi:MAG: transglutaminase family protein [Planctomycetes bacterium]|nr:transglutaminase family protein [Planctomycetota bacterium]